MASFFFHLPNHSFPLLDLWSYYPCFLPYSPPPLAMPQLSIHPSYTLLSTPLAIPLHSKLLGQTYNLWSPY
ncbi:hypothetical protein L873DRAFT_160279 [Choiromyces venosus 120613-1]|uniref:Uncharacterized protein n=1 Tax=Choiromyces venosus 120613-1 TaxID=1336337 RepID=A0A3N4JYS9_9PEZI|nr:hypothetical protein L873DRAFT_160279 [Choiromyces venosus 120613-1]